MNFSNPLNFSEVNAGFFYKTAEEREKLVRAERKFTDDKVRQVIEFKKKVCNATDKGFVIVNQKVSVFLLQIKPHVSKLIVNQKVHIFLVCDTTHLM